MARRFTAKRGALSKRAKMGPRKYSKRTRRARPSKRAKPSTTVVKAVGVPDRMFVKLPYTDVQTLAASVAGYDQKAYNINNVWDPETGTINESAYALAPFAGLYNKFRVTHVKYNVEIINPTGNAQAGFINFAPQGEGLNVGSSFNTWSTNNTRQFTLRASPQGIIKLKGTQYNAKLFGITPERYRTSEEFWGTTNGSNPQTMAQLNIGCRNLDGTQASLFAFLKVKLVYYVELFDKKENLTGTERADGPHVPEISP